MCMIDDIKYYKGNIKPEDNVIFVFGSNPEGRHGKGAALTARLHFGAIYGQARGIQGNSYAIVTKELRNNYPAITIDNIYDEILKLYEYAKCHKEKKFCIAYRTLENEKSLCGYTGYELLQLFLKPSSIPSNIYFSEEWYKIFLTRYCKEFQTVLF